MLVLTDHERRLLAFLDQLGPTHRCKVVWELAHPESRIGWARDHGRGLGGSGSNNAEPMIMANWCRRLIAAGYVREHDDREGFYRHHEITAAGRKFFREDRLSAQALTTMGER